MDDPTRAALTSLRDTFTALGTQLAALVVALTSLLASDTPVPPVVVPPSNRLLLKPVTGLTIKRGSMSDRGILEAAFPTLKTRPAGVLAGWADPSTSLSLNPDGSFEIEFDKARTTLTPNSGGSSWVNAAIPLPEPVPGAILSYRLEFLAPFEAGESMKFPGLERWVEGQTPGGGEITPRNFTVRPCTNDWNQDAKSIRFGPYVYSQEQSRPPVADDPWPQSPNYPGGTLRWWAPVVPALDRMSGGRFDVSVTVRRNPESGQGLVSTMIQAVNADGAPIGAAGIVTGVWQLLGSEPVEITHVPFVFMYGGDAPKYGPKTLQVTRVRCSRFEVWSL